MIPMLLAEGFEVIVVRYAVGMEPLGNYHFLLREDLFDNVDGICSFRRRFLSAFQSEGNGVVSAGEIFGDFYGDEEGFQLAVCSEDGITRCEVAEKVGVKTGSFTEEVVVGRGISGVSDRNLFNLTDADELCEGGRYGEGEPSLRGFCGVVGGIGGLKAHLFAEQCGRAGFLFF